MRTMLVLGVILAYAGAAVAQETTDPRKQEIVNKLSTMRISLDFKDTSLDDAISFLRDFTGINFYIDPDIRTKLSDDQLKVTMHVNDLLLKSALKLMITSKDLTVVYKEGVLVVQHKDKAQAAVSMQVYDVRDLLFKLQDFPGPKVELQQGSGGGGALTGATFTLEEPKSVVTEEFITEMVKTNTGERSWDENPNASINLANGLLVVTQSRRVHEEIRRLLNLLRQFK